MTSASGGAALTVVGNNIYLLSNSGALSDYSYSVVGQMIPVIALIGRPNVGKSTLFNGLTRSRDALVADEPGLTRDRQYGLGHQEDNY